MSAALDLAPLRSDRAPQFTADVVVSLDGDGRPALSVSITIPHTELQWIRLAAGYASGVELTVIFQSRRAGREYGEAWDRRLVVAGFESTTSPTLALVERRTLAVPPGPYELRVQARDLNSGEASTATERLEVPDYSRVPVGFVDMELGTADSAGTFTPVSTRRYGLDSRRLAARVALFDRRPGAWPRTYPFRYRILDAGGGQPLAGRQDLTVARTGAPVVVRPASPDLFVGEYVFEVELVEGRSRWRVERSFEVEVSGAPRGRAYEEMLEPLEYIADPREVERLRFLPAEERDRGWEEFWRSRDPSPETPRNEALLEFLRRLRYAEQHFQSFGPGWRSDMGRIYIKFGTPDQIDGRPATAQTPRLEIWYYNRPYRRFVFADREGFGRFVLIGPTIE